MFTAACWLPPRPESGLRVQVRCHGAACRLSLLGEMPLLVDNSGWAWMHQCVECTLCAHLLLPSPQPLIFSPVPPGTLISILRTWNPPLGGFDQHLIFPVKNLIYGASRKLFPFPRVPLLAGTAASPSEPGSFQPRGDQAAGEGVLPRFRELQAGLPAAQAQLVAQHVSRRPFAAHACPPILRSHAFLQIASPAPCLPSVWGRST